MRRNINAAIRVTLLLFLFFVAPLLTAEAEGRMKMHKNQESMKKEVAKHIPIGSNIKEAQRIMEANGFTCIIMENESFADMGEYGPVKTYRNQDFLWCDKVKSVLLLCERRWQVILIRKDDKVADIFVSIGLTCP
jgi:hypothetical protein